MGAPAILGLHAASNPSGSAEVATSNRAVSKDEELSAFPDFEHTAVAVAAKLGIACDRPLILAKGLSAVVHLRPHPIVARVTRVTHLIRSVDEVAGTVALARALPGLVVPPSDQIDPGPHVADGRYVTFWTHVETVPATPGEAGSSLRALHDAARRFDGTLRSFDPRPDALVETVSRVSPRLEWTPGDGRGLQGTRHRDLATDRRRRSTDVARHPRFPSNMDDGSIPAASSTARRHRASTPPVHLEPGSRLEPYEMATTLGTS